MKLVKEHIYEKFTPDSDPIEDMGIGESYLLRKKFYELQRESYVGSIKLSYDEDKDYYYVEMYYAYNDLIGVTAKFFKHIDRKYINGNFFKSIGSLRVIAGYIVKPEYVNIFKKALEFYNETS
jgi:hypothetical protein